MTKDIKEVQEKISHLIGWEAQKLMSPVHRVKQRTPEGAYRRAGVLLLLFPDVTGELNLVYIIRTSSNPNDKHAGQIAFPGGKYEETDESMLACALRETEEEIGVAQKDVTILGPLSNLYIPVSNFMIYPYVGYVEQKPAFTLQEEEVDGVLTIKLADLLAEDNKFTTDITTSYSTIKEVPSYHVHDKTLWGASAMVTSELEQLLKS